MATLTVIWWRDIPAQVIARAAGVSVQTVANVKNGR